MKNGEFLELAKTKVAMLNNFASSSKVSSKDVFTVWYAKTLQNHKALLATPILGDNHYYEVTYNGDKNELYLDVYTKELNKCYKIEEN